MNKGTTVRQVFVVLAVLGTITANALANAIPLNGQATGEISDRFEVFFVPAGYVFSIWGLIYLGMLAYAVFQALPAQKKNPQLSSISALFVLSSVANVAWIFLWHYEFFPLTVVAMLALLGSLIAIYLRLEIGRGQVVATMKWLVHLPFSIYLGWITVATIANITSLLYFFEWDGWGITPEAWTLIMLAAAVVIGGTISLTRRDVAFAAVLIWAFIGIALKHQDTAVVATATWLAALITVAVMLVGISRRRQQGLRIAPGT